MSTSSENKSIPFQNAVVPPGQLQMNERKCMWCEEKNDLLSSMTIPRYIACYNHLFTMNETIFKPHGESLQVDASN